MRKLTIKRRRAFAGCASKVKIYVQDPSGDTIIEGRRCRCLVKLKNNESVTLEIGNESLKLFSKFIDGPNKSENECYIVPAGEEDYFVSGAVQFNPYAGNPFYFDKVTDSQALRNRKKLKSSAIFFFVALALGVFIMTLIWGLTR